MPISVNTGDKAEVVLINTFETGGGGVIVVLRIDVRLLTDQGL